MADVDLSAPTTSVPAAEASGSERLAFLRKTYGHVLGAVMVFILLEYVLFTSGIATSIVGMMTGVWWSWLVVIGLFMGASVLADRMARADAPVPQQYAGLGLYVLAEAFIFLPLLYYPIVVMGNAAGREVLIFAAGATFGLFAVLSAVVFISGKDFSFLGGILGIGMLIALAAFVISAFVGWNLGLFFGIAMIALAGGFVLYNTSKVLHHYPTDAPVAASLSITASLGLMFYYVLFVVLQFAGDN
jgi:FtsH-binding integral membrane protein